MVNRGLLLSLKKKVSKEILCETAFRLLVLRDRSRTCPFSMSKNLCRDESAQVGAGELEGVAARPE